jgi:hypothetical protein
MMNKLSSATLVSVLLSALSGCAYEASDEARGEPAASTEEAFTVMTLGPAGYALPICTDASGFCKTTIQAPSYLPPHGDFALDTTGLYFASYRANGDFYTAVRLDWFGNVVSQSAAMPGKPAVKNPSLWSGRYVFGDGAQNVVMDVSGATPAYTAFALPFSQYPKIHGTGGVVVGSGRFISTFNVMGAARGTLGDAFMTNRCGPAPYDCQRPAADRAPGASDAWVVALPYGLEYISAPPNGAVTQTDAFCRLASGQIDPDAPLVTASDINVGGLHAAMRLTTGTLIDCRQTGAAYAPVQRAIPLPATPTDYDFDPDGNLWITIASTGEVAFRSRATGAVQRFTLTTALPGSTVFDDFRPHYVKALPDGSAVVLTRGDRFVRVWRAL